MRGPDRAPPQLQDEDGSMNTFPQTTASTAWPAIDAVEPARRALDLAGALLLLVLAAPLMLLTALVLLLLQGRPILYSQTRVGRGGVPFRIHKFRSMRRDAEADGRARWARIGDDRITPAGRLIRLTRIDELPQLLNVLRGDMSLVGPRPERPEFVAQLGAQLPGYAQRHGVKPGITGWAQVRGAYAASMEESAAKLQHDLHYLRHRSLALDLRILAETVRVVISGAGAR